MSEEKIVTAALIIIGNEILSGRIQDANLSYIATKLNDEAGIRLTEARVVPDIEAEIVDAVNAMRTKHDYVFTTGGIGPTHDDITAEAVSKAMGVRLIRHPEAERRLQAYYPPDKLTEARLRMANTAEGATLIDNPVSIAPGFRIGKVHVLAGVPQIAAAMMDNVVPTLEGGAVTHHFEHLHLPANALGDMVLAVIDGSNNDDRDRVAAVLIIIFRYRNNLFHGVKWQYKLAGQLENFTNANSALMKVLDRHGALEEG